VAKRQELKKRAGRHRVDLTRLIWPNYAVITPALPSVCYPPSVVCRTSHAPAVVSRPPVPT
jgi:hypothetical protein